MSTRDGIDHDRHSVPYLPIGGTYHNCLVSVGNDTLVSVGRASDPTRPVLRYTLGGPDWEFLNSTVEERSGSGCGLVTRFDYFELLLQVSETVLIITGTATGTLWSPAA